MRSHAIAIAAVLVTSSSTVLGGGVARYQNRPVFLEDLDNPLLEAFDDFGSSESLSSLPSIGIASLSGTNRWGTDVSQFVTAQEDVQFNLLDGHDTPSLPNLFSNDLSREGGWGTGHITFNFEGDMDAIGFIVADGNAIDQFEITLYNDDVLVGYARSSRQRELPDSFLGVITDTPFDMAVIGATSARDSWAIDDLYVQQAVPTPGALALLGLAGLAGTRRRRA